MSAASPVLPGRLIERRERSPRSHVLREALELQQQLVLGFRVSLPGEGTCRLRGSAGPRSERPSPARSLSLAARSNTGSASLYRPSSYSRRAST